MLTFKHVILSSVVYANAHCLLELILVSKISNI